MYLWDGDSSVLSRIDLDIQILSKYLDIEYLDIQIYIYGYKDIQIGLCIQNNKACIFYLSTPIDTIIERICFLFSQYGRYSSLNRYLSIIYRLFIQADTFQVQIEQNRQICSVNLFEFLIQNIVEIDAALMNRISYIQMQHALDSCHGARNNHNLQANHPRLQVRVSQRRQWLLMTVGLQNIVSIQVSRYSRQMLGLE